MNPAFDVDPEAPPACRAGGPLRVLIVHQTECAFSCLWHLTTLFERMPSQGEILWQSCSPADLKEPAAAARAVEQACEADVIVFCACGSTEVSLELRGWMERWLPAKAGQEAALGLLLANREDGGVAMAYLRDAAQRGRMTFLGVGHCVELAAGEGTTQAGRCRPVRGRIFGGTNPVEDVNE